MVKRGPACGSQNPFVYKTLHENGGKPAKLSQRGLRHQARPELVQRNKDTLQWDDILPILGALNESANFIVGVKRRVVAMMQTQMCAAVNDLILTG